MGQRMSPQELVLNKLEEVIGQVMTFVRDKNYTYTANFYVSFCMCCEFLEKMIIPHDELAPVWARVRDCGQALCQDDLPVPDYFLERLEEFIRNINEYYKEKQ